MNQGWTLKTGKMFSGATFECTNVFCRAYWLTVTNQVYITARGRKLWTDIYWQRWLGIRIDFLGAMLTFVVAILTVATRFTISPSQTGVV
jgi:hypothetical protein